SSKKYKPIFVVVNFVCRSFWAPSIPSELAATDDEPDRESAAADGARARGLADHAAHSARVGSPDAADRTVRAADPRAGPSERHADHPRYVAESGPLYRRGWWRRRWGRRRRRRGGRRRGWASGRRGGGGGCV